MSVDQASPQNADKAVELLSKGAVASAQLGLSGDPASLERPRPDAKDAHEDLEWWKRSVFYQIFPLSFQDSDGDGKGDLPGIIARLHYLEWLGIDAVWLSPIYPSPFSDGGYDISDFQGVAPILGTLEDFDRLLDGLHARGIRLILDFVPNHTSDRHPWFQESRSSRTNPKRDWYVWADPGTDGGGPNNWLSRLGGSAWEWDETTGQYYYHAFLKAQPDLNWRNPEVRQAMADVLRFWMRRGVDGFRMDASAVLVEDDLLRDDPPNPEFNDDMPPPERFMRIFTDGRPETFEFLTELRKVIDEFSDRVLAGEVQGDISRIARFYDEEQRPRFHLPLNFCLIDTPWDARSIAVAIDQYLNVLPPEAWPDWVLGGHDKPRLAGQIGPAQASIAAMLLLTLPGTPFFYAGDEIGTPEICIPPDRVQDPFERLVPGYGLNRDPERTPMHWDATAKAGFTHGEPWLPIGEDISECNVATQREDGRSILHLYRHLIALRRSEAALIAGAYEPQRTNGDILCYRRRSGGDVITVLLNFGGSSEEISLPAEGEVVLSTHLDRWRARVGSAVHIRPDEGILVRSRAG